MRPPKWGHTAIGCIRPAHSEREWQLVIVDCAWRCFYCARLLIVGDEIMAPTKDHLCPISRGGCQCRGNLVAACGKCNSMKKERTVAEFINSRQAFAPTTGRFYTSITLLEPLVNPKHDPLLNAAKRLAEKKAMPCAPERYLPSRYWRSLR